MGFYNGHQDSVRALVSELKLGVYLPVQVQAAEVLQAQAELLDTLEARLAELRDVDDSVVAFGMRR